MLIIFTLEIPIPTYCYVKMMTRTSTALRDDFGERCRRLTKPSPSRGGGRIVFVSGLVTSQCPIVPAWRSDRIKSELLYLLYVSTYLRSYPVIWCTIECPGKSNLSSVCLLICRVFWLAGKHDRPTDLDMLTFEQI